VSAGNGLFSLLGFMGLYALLSIAFVLLMSRVVGRGAAGVGATSPTFNIAPVSEGVEAAQ
jgi:cytochrome bd-type quinol oxidase subunit 1